MAKVLVVNYTNEKMEGMHAGIKYVLDPGAMKEMSDKAANHLLETQGLSRRGLRQQSATDDPEIVRQEAVATNREFKLKMIEKINAQNERRRLSGLSYIEPNKKIKAYADELGIDLKKSYAIEDKSKSDVRELQFENANLRNELLEMKSMMKDFMEAAKPKIDMRTKEGKILKAKLEAEKHQAEEETQETEE